MTFGAASDARRRSARPPAPTDLSRSERKQCRARKRPHQSTSHRLRAAPWRASFVARVHTHDMHVVILANQSAGLGDAGALLAELCAGFRQILGNSRVDSVVLNGHPAIREHAARAMAAATGPIALIAAGGGGTLRAVVEAVCAHHPLGLPEPPGQLRIAALRLGSGNVLAKRLGVPAAPAAAARHLAECLRSNRWVAVPVLCCSSFAGPSELRRYGVTLAGFGQFGRIPGSLDRAHRRWPRARRLAARTLGAERLTTLEYAVAFGARVGASVVVPQTCERVEVTHDRGVESFRFLSGAAMSFAIPGLPVRPVPGTRGISCFLMPRFGPTRRYTITPRSPLQLRLLEPASREFFIDEDPEEWSGTLSLTWAGELAFVTAEET